MPLRTATVPEDRDMLEVDAAAQQPIPADPSEPDDTVWMHPHVRWLTGLRAPAFIPMMAVYAFIGKMLAFTLINPFIQLSGSGSPVSRSPLNMIQLIRTMAWHRPSSAPSFWRPSWRPSSGSGSPSASAGSSHKGRWC